MNKIICLVGESGSGKTTIAELIEKELGIKTHKTDKYICDNCNQEFYGCRNINSLKYFCSSKCHKEYRKRKNISVKFVDSSTVNLCIKDKVIIIDCEDYEKIKDYSWYINKTGYAFAWNKERTKLFYMHRIIMDSPKNMDVDHINHNTLDNRKENLRICETYKNMQNLKQYRNNTSGMKGVSYNKNEKQWVARIQANKKSIFLGYYSNKEDAINARKKADEKYFGEFTFKESDTNE